MRRPIRLPWRHKDVLELIYPVHYLRDGFVSTLDIVVQMVLEDISFLIYADTKSCQPFGCGTDHDEVIPLPLGQRDFAELAFGDRVSWYWFGFRVLEAETFAKVKCIGFTLFQAFE